MASRKILTALAPMIQRLESFKKKTDYTYFDYIEHVIWEIDASIIPKNNQTVTFVDKLVSRIEKMYKGEPNYELWFNDYFSNQATIDKEIEDEFSMYVTYLTMLKIYTTVEIEEADKRNNILPFVHKDYPRSTEKIRIMKRSLVLYHFLAATTKIRDFELLFTGQKLSENKLKWIGSIEALYYFIQQLINKGVVKYPFKRIKWEIVQLSFIVKGQKTLENISKQHTPNPRDKELLNKIIATQF